MLGAVSEETSIAVERLAAHRKPDFGRLLDVAHHWRFTFAFLSENLNVPELFLRSCQSSALVRGSAFGEFDGALPFR